MVYLNQIMAPPITPEPEDEDDEEEENETRRTTIDF